jgi:hypothetical protein
VSLGCVPRQLERAASLGRAIAALSRGSGDGFLRCLDVLEPEEQAAVALVSGHVAGIHQSVQGPKRHP